jgi:hypothetical protein
MADKIPAQGSTPLESTDRVYYKEILSGVYALVQGAALMVGTNLVSLANRLPVDANLQVGDVNVSIANPVPTDANLQVGGVDVSDTNPVPIESDGITISQTPSITAGVYVAGDNVGGLLEFANAAREIGSGGVIKSMEIIDDASQSVVLELWLFNQTFEAGADNAVWTPVEADLENLVTVITSLDGTWYTGGATATVNDTEISKRYDVVGTSLFGRLVTRGAPTYVAIDDLTVKLGLLQD